MGGVTTMRDVVGRTRGPWRFNMLVFSLFGGVALALAGVGLFGVVAYEVTQRTREIGLRMALGAARGHVVRLMVSQGAKPAAIGLGIGVLASLLLTRVMSGLLFAVSPTDPVTFAVVSVLLGAVAVLASYLPARRAASVDPQAALRRGLECYRGAKRRGLPASEASRPTARAKRRAAYRGAKGAGPPRREAPRYNATLPPADSHEEHERCPVPARFRPGRSP